LYGALVLQPAAAIPGAALGRDPQRELVDVDDLDPLGELSVAELLQPLAQVGGEVAVEGGEQDVLAVSRAEPVD
jgi:hypothetical protein